MAPIDRDTIRRWRREADARRASAAAMTDQQARQGMLNAAYGYDALADDAEARFGLAATAPAAPQSCRSGG